MSKSPKISVVIPSYNKVKFIGETLDSIFLQKYPNLEVIIQDGGSTDGTLDVIKHYAKKYRSALKWESKKDKGQLDAISKGLTKASGDIFTFINADDCYEIGAFSAIAKAYVKNPESLWFAGKGVVIDSNGREIAKLITWYKNIFLFLNRKSLILILNYFMQPSVFISKNVYQKYGPFTGTHDFVTEYDLWLKLGKMEMPTIINQNISRFRIEPSTKTKRLFTPLLYEDEKIVKKYTKNPLIILLHNINNFGRVIVEKFI